MIYDSFFRELEDERAKTAQFYLADLHVHTHDSSDYPMSAERLAPADLEQQVVIIMH